MKTATEHMHGWTVQPLCHNEGKAAAQQLRGCAAEDVKGIWSPDVDRSPGLRRTAERGRREAGSAEASDPASPVHLIKACKLLTEHQHQGSEQHGMSNEPGLTMQALLQTSGESFQSPSPTIKPVATGGMNAASLLESFMRHSMRARAPTL